MNTPSELKYTKSHEWIQFLNETTVRIGLTDYAQNALGDLVFVNLPQVGDQAAKGETIADVESVKAVSDIYSPVSGTVSAVNEALLDAPGNINGDPYGAWIIEIEIKDVTEQGELLTAREYDQVCQEEG